MLSDSDIDISEYPDPSKRLPWEEFQALEDSEALLLRAVYWCHYASWMMDDGTNATRDAYQLHAAWHNMMYKGMAFVSRDKLYRAQHYSETPDSIQGMCFIVIVVVFSVCSFFARELINMVLSYVY